MTATTNNQTNETSTKTGASDADQKSQLIDYTGQVEAIRRSQAVIEFNLEGIIQFANENFLQCVGYTLDEIVGKHHRIFADPKYAASPEYAAFWHRLSKGEFFSGEFQRFGKGGKEIWIQASYNPIFDDEGKPFKVVKYASDITQQKKSASEAQILAGMLEGAGAMFMACDTDLVITYVNPAVTEMLRTYEADIRKFLPKFDSSKLIGTCIDDFHKNPAHQRGILGNPSMLPVTSELKLGPLTFGVRAAALYDEDGNLSGASVEWTDYNAREAYREQVAKVIAGSESGDLSVRGDVESLDKVYQPMMKGINEILDAVVRPITEASEVLQELADANMTARMTGEYEGDFNKIKVNLNNAASSLEEALMSVADSAGQVGAASSQISEGAQKLAEGASTQASSIEEISASLQEMQAMTGQNADNAGQANQLAGEAVASADKGNNAMVKMEEAIDRIKSSSDQTAKIVKTIDEIAFQTNLLALNAAVEAARAGDAGKGFAVVAEEVRSLAKRSAEAAKTTAELIDGAVKNAEGGVSITQDVRSILTDIVDGSRKVNDLIAEIASASKEQAEGIKQITEGVTSMDKVTQENSANSEESAAAASQLNEQAQALNQMIGRFNLGGQSKTKALAEAVATSKAPVKQNKPLKPQQVIPLDDDDLAQF